MAFYKRNDCKEFGLAVKQRLAEVEMTQKELAEITGISRVYLYRITNGVHPGLKHREKIRAVLGMPSIKELINSHLNKDETKQ